jgi:hypothetical protein
VTTTKDHSPSPSTTTAATTSLRTFQVMATLSVVVVFYQFLTAGQLLPQEPAKSLVTLHAAGAYGVHVFTFLTAAAAFWHYRRSGGPLWPTVLATGVLLVGFVQAYYGNRNTLYIHIPGAMLLTAGVVWIMVWSFGRTARTTH